MSISNIQIGTRFGYWTIIDNTISYEGNGKSVLAKCDCGAEHYVREYSLRVKGTQGCAACNKLKTKFKDKNHSIYNTWRSIKERCLNKNHKSYHYYGGRGISVCSKWGDFSGFIEDMGGTWELGKTIDRINNDKGYYKENCRWATPMEQVRKRSNTKVTPEIAACIRQEYRDTPATTQYLADKYKLGRTTVRHIIAGNTWRNPDEKESTELKRVYNCRSKKNESQVAKNV